MIEDPIEVARLQQQLSDAGGFLEAWLERRQAGFEDLDAQVAWIRGWAVEQGFNPDAVLDYAVETARIQFEQPEQAGPPEG